MSKNKYLTIGEVSKITGSHIKSLRYYDKIGALKPAHIDPDTGYRYYTYPQLGIVDVIQTCIALDIPLKIFMEYCEDNGNKIHYAKLLEHGKEMSKKKIRTIRSGLKYINELQQEMERSDRILTEQPKFFELPRKRYLVERFHHELHDKEYHLTLANLYLSAVENGYKAGYEFGYLYIYRKDAVERYQFIDILSAVKRNAPNIKTFPPGQYLAKRVMESKIETAPEAFPELFSKEYDQVVIETELFTGEYNIEKPLFELRCLALSNL